MNYTSVKTPTWGNGAHTGIIMWVTFDGVGEVSFFASPNDPEEHGRELFARASEGEFGEIAEYVAPVIQRVIPESVTRFQAKAALSQVKDRDGISMLTRVEDYLTSKADDITKLAWSEALHFVRKSTMVRAIAAMLELTSEQVDDLFIFASTIE